MINHFSAPIGESVVSASAEPDTLILEVDLSSNRVRGIKAVTVGAKRSKIELSADGTKEIELEQDQRTRCCLDNNGAIAVGNIGLSVSAAHNCWQFVLIVIIS